ncbi:MAG: hypothetical protein AAB555_01210 [Patescibacteria group bacterium]
MENQPTGQIAEQTIKRDSSAKIWYIAGAAIIIALGLLYFVMKPPTTAPTESDTTADISAGLDQIPDSSAELDADASAVSGDIQAI